MRRILVTLGLLTVMATTAGVAGTSGWTLGLDSGSGRPVTGPVTGPVTQAPSSAPPAAPSVTPSPTPSPAPTGTPTQAVAPRASIDASPVLYRRGDDGPAVRRVQARLRQIGWFFGDVTDHYGRQTRTAVAGFQAKRGVPVTGSMDRHTLDLLVGMTRRPTADDLANKAPDPAKGARLDPRCTTGRALCIDKTTQSLRWVVDGKVLSTLAVRFGAWDTPTREGLFHVYVKDRDHVSHEYGSAMPFSMFFSGGQAVHYSSDFAARGYYGASHGCVNVRDYNGIARLFDEVRVGDKVVVYRS